jgi:hypothetical protein
MGGFYTEVDLLRSVTAQCSSYWSFILLTNFQARFFKMQTLSSPTRLKRRASLFA